MQALLIPFILVAGAMQAFGAVMSAQLRVSLTNPWLATTVAFAINAMFFASLFAVRPLPLPTAEGIASMQWWAPLSGLVGAVAVVAGLLFVDKIGAAALNGSIITGNLLASLLIDHFGLMGAEPHPINIGRIGGAVLLLGGVFLINKF